MPSFANPDGSFLNESGGSPVRVAVPATGDTITMRGERALYVNHAADIAALTIMFPSVEPGEKVEIWFVQAVTALTIKDASGNAVTGAPTAATDGLFIVWRFINKTIGWKTWK